MNEYRAPSMIRVASRYDSSGETATDKPLGRASSYTRRETRLAALNKQEQDSSTKDYKKVATLTSVCTSSLLVPVWIQYDGWIRTSRWRFNWTFRTVLKCSHCNQIHLTNSRPICSMRLLCPRKKHTITIWQYIDFISSFLQQHVNYSSHKKAHTHTYI